MYTKMLQPLFLSSLILTSTVGWTAETPDRIATVWSDDFESGELNAWDSYPPAQDPGFDPRIVCVSEPAYDESKFSLMRLIEPADTDYPDDMHLVGMTKQHRLWLDRDSALSFAAFISGDRRARYLWVILAAADGTRYEFKWENPLANQWILVGPTLDDLRSGDRPLEAGTQIVAVAIYAQFGPLNPHLSYALHIDDFEVKGQSRRRFETIDPPSTYLDKFYSTVLQRHFYRGENITLSLRPQKGDRPIELETVNCTLVDSKNETRKLDIPLYDDGTHGDLQAGDEIWSNDALHRIAASNPAGRWKIAVQGRGTQGDYIYDELYFLVPPRRLTPADQPRLHFSTEKLEAFKSQWAAVESRETLDRIVHQ